MFSNEPELKPTRMFRPVRQVAARRANSIVSDCILFVFKIYYAFISV